MKRFYLFFITICLLQGSFGQNEDNFIDSKGFNSIFQNNKTGTYLGTSNGVFLLKNCNGNEVILDFQGSFGSLEIEIDSNEMYDVSSKIYFGKTTSGKTEIKYKTYGFANSIGINLNGQWFELSAIDGACDLIINGLKYTYKTEPTVEYLIINIEKEIELSNWNYLLKHENDNIDKLKAQKKTITILPHSVIVFAIKRK